MLRKKHFLSRAEWSYPDILSIDFFLEDFKHELTYDNVNDNLEFLKDYRNKSKSDTVTLTFGNCKLEVQGIDEATATIRGLEYALNEMKTN
ncbi:hypothetical protein H0J01_001024 [Listeria monocytogenes]|uniref:hypothetical protein n=1 Tax=Listeria monocytogenes TaxID=1639 RepID=UPI000E71678B|nr:hypothetical protein [Listeria monocytogenes]EAE0271721.1 hypothetical protein [Listeria monocytogenes]EAE0420474.1 hypothetical protein [Listeria monocytogenes]EAF2384295.1 hypothetical protein [Listeria monocytogenes]EAF7299705.1 hypothetical protein [Listeria monocytogenes]EAL8030654.1 hypothetical protein [Listeria monocytogenes]